jgi:hypothetical protein
MLRLRLLVVMVGTLGVIGAAGTGPSSGATPGSCAVFTAKQLPSFVLRARDMPKGTKVYSVYRPGGDRYLLLPPRTRASFGLEFDVGANGAATALAMLFRNARSAAAGLGALAHEYSGKRAPDGGLGEERWAISGRFGLPLGLHYGWRVKNVVLLFSLRGTSRAQVNAAEALRLAVTMDSRVHC